MVRFVIYKNSILATICSMIGAVCIVMAVSGLVGKEIGILPGITMIAVGLGLMFLAGIISEHKEKKKKAKAAAKAANAQASASASNIGYAQPNVNTAYTQPQQSVQTAGSSIARGKPVNKSAVFAGIFFLLATLLGVWYVFSPYMKRIDHLALVECAGFLLLAIGCFRMKRTQRANAFHVIGALLLAMVFAYRIFNSLKRAIFPFWSHGIHLTFSGFVRTLAHDEYSVGVALSFLAFLLVALFAFCAMKPKGRGGFTGALWFLPSVLLAAYLVIQFVYNYSLNRLLNDFVENPRWMPHPLMLTLFRDIHVVVACFLAGLCFRRICRSRVDIPQTAAPYVQPTPQHEPSVQFVQPQPEVRYTAPEPLKTAAPRRDDAEIAKQIQAYKDLLDCGILTQEECEQKIRELTHG